MRILVVTSNLAPYRVEWFDELAKHSEVSILYTRESEKDRDAKWMSVRPKSCIYYKMKTINFRGLDYAYNLSKHINSNAHDILLFDGYGLLTNIYGIFKYARKGNVVINIDGGMVEKKDNLLFKFLKTRIFSTPAHFICGGEIGKKYMLKYIPDNARICTHPFTSLREKDIVSQISSADEKKKIRDQIGVSESQVILSVGQFIYRKAIEVLLKACSNISADIGVYIIGGQPTDEYLEICRKLRLKNIHFISFVQKAELEKYYKAADLFVLPTREDIWGLVINEAMANGLPVITTNRCNAGVELVKDYENGFIVPVDDHRALSDRINEVMNDVELRESMARSSLKRIKPYTIENMASIQVSFFKNIVGEKIE